MCMANKCEILLSEHKVNNWYTHDSISIRGGIFNKQNEYLCCQKLFDVGFSNCIESNISILKTVNGNYSVVVNNDEFLFAAVDRVSFYPLFYTVVDGILYIGDSMKAMQDIKGRCIITEEKRDEFLSQTFISGSSTIFEGIFMLEAGQYLCMEKSTCKFEVKDYFLHLHKATDEKSMDSYISDLNKVVNNVFERLIQSVQGRTILLFLSGGYDSKLVAVKLKELGYENVVCFSFGPDDCKDVVCAKEIAKKLGYKLLRLDITKEWFSDFMRGEEFFHGYTEGGYGFSVQYLQSLLIKDLVKHGDIPADSIVVNGNSGDAIEGNDICKMFIEGNTYTISDIAKQIMNQHCCMNGKINMCSDNIKRSVLNIISGLYNTEAFSEEAAQDIYEYYNWRERQSKYVVNDVFCITEILGLEWRMPLWDNEFVDFWLSLPYRYRKDRYLYYKFVGNDALPSANEITLERRIIDAVKKWLPWLVNGLYFVIRTVQVLAHRNDIFGYYWLYNRRGLLKLLLRTKAYKFTPITVLTNYTYDKCYAMYRKAD